MFVWIGVFVVIVVGLILKIAGRWSQATRKIALKFDELMYWNLIVRLVIECMLEFCLCTMMDFKVENTSSWGYFFSYGLSYFVVLGVIGYALFIKLYLKKYTEILLEPKMKKRFYTAYDGLNFEDVKRSLTSQEYYVYRRLIYAGIAFFTFD